MSAMDETTQAPERPAQDRKVLRAMLVLGAVGAAWFVWLMVQSGFDLNLRAKVGALVKIAETPSPAAKLAEAKASHPLLAEFAIDPNGAVRMTLKGSPELDGKALALIPQVVDGKVVGWRCASDAPRRFLPRNCNL